MERRAAVNTLGKRIRWMRTMRGLDQKTLADAIGLTGPYLSQMENDHVNPRASVVVRLAHFFGVTTDFLLLGKGVLDVIEEDEFQGELRATSSATAEPCTEEVASFVMDEGTP